jgi:excinuclease ABC subunit C
MNTPILGAEAIRAALLDMPRAPGVYRMIGEGGRVLYIGKAKDLRARITSYATARDLTTRILRMIAQVSAVEHVVTQSEAEALLVEANFIRRYRPHYNILLKDDKSFPYLRITGDHDFPRIEKHRGAQNKAGEYFGPFASVGALNDTLALLQKIFLLRPCSDSYFKNRTRPCLQYQIKRCSAPCVGKISVSDYGEQLARARDFLRGRGRDVQDMLTAEMDAASAAMEYERAAQLRDRIRALTQVQQEQGLRTAGLTDADAIALARRGDRSVVLVSFYRNGGHFGQQRFTPRHEAEATDAEVMAAFLAQFYQSHTPPPEILVSHAPDEAALLAEALQLHTRYAVDIRTPERGDKRRLMEQLSASAETLLAQVMMERASVASHLEALKNLFGLRAPPARIEVYDNSHTMGTNAIGAFIVATPDGFDKRSYRSFTIKDAAGDDDYGMMREVMRRRFKNSATQDNPEGRDPTLPDLLLIDGGLGQLHAVEEELKILGIQRPALVAIAKGVDRNAGREWFFMPGCEPFQLPVNDPLLHYLERLRDEAHRFAIGKHRNKRSAAMTVSALDDIPGIGASRKRALLLHFGARDAIETASLAELENVAGISKKTAKAIYDYFHG